MTEQSELTLADALDRAASILEREEVTYAMGLDLEHVSEYRGQVVEVEKTDKNGNKYVVDEFVPTTEEEMLAEIAEHERFVEFLRAQAAQLRDGAGA